MEWELRHLRTFVAAIDAGTFTDAAIELGISQAAVSRTIAALETALGAPLLSRDRHGCTPTGAGLAILPQARRILTESARLPDVVATQRSTLRLGYAWSAVGKHTTPLLRGWAADHPESELQLVRHNSATGGLAEGFCDAAIIRTSVDDRRFAQVTVGLERRVVAFAADDPDWARRRKVTMAEIAERTILIDERTGTTTLDLWAESARPHHTLPTTDVENWLDSIAAGKAVGTTAEATAIHNPRPGVVYRPVSDGPVIPVHLIWRKDDPPDAIQTLADTLTQLYRR